MENKENYIRKDIVKSIEEAIVEIFNCNNRSSDLSVVDVIEAAKELHNLNKAEETELYLFVKYTQIRFIRLFNVVVKSK